MLLEEIKHLTLSKKPDSALIERVTRAYWERNRTYAFSDTDTRPIYTIDTPPPTVSGTLHTGHGLSFTQIDFDARFRRMTGHAVMFPMGYDDNGLPTERYTERVRDIRIHDVSRKRFTEICLEETHKAIQEYTEVWKRLGMSIDWDRTYSTIDKMCRRIGQRSFIDLYQKGLVERRREPAIWCPSCRTTIAEADIDEVEKETDLVYFDLEVNKKPITVASTRPELLPGCVALAVNPKDERYSDLIGKKARVPSLEHLVDVIATERIATDFGTGAMMVCTFGDRNDVDLWREHELPLRNVFDESGKCVVEGYEGLTISQMKERVISQLRSHSALRKIEKRTHAERSHDRCDTPIEYMVKPQWFVKVLDRKSDWLDAAERIEWHPSYMKERYVQWVENLKWDWCISRQRAFGVPFPVWYAGEHVIVPDIADLPVDPLEGVPHGYGADELRPETDIMDTWMTSSMTPLINARWGEEDENRSLYPSNVRPQAHDIIRTWLFYSVIKGIYHTGSVPFNKVMISGHGHDKHGKKMSKSKGNIVTPEKVITDYSADAFRLWAAHATLGNDVRFKEQEVAEQRGLINKLWNAAKFSSLHATPSSHEVLYEPELIDRWILHYLNETASETKESMMQHNYHIALDKARSFFRHQVCDNYLEIIKHRLYEEEPVTKKAAKITLDTVLLGSMKMFAAFMPNTTEFLYLHLYAQDDGESIHASPWPKYSPQAVDTHARDVGDLAIHGISAIRRWKSRHDLGQGKPLSYVLLGIPGKDDIHHVGDVISRSQRVSNISFDESEYVSVLDARIAD